MGPVLTVFEDKQSIQVLISEFGARQSDVDVDVNAKCSVRLVRTKRPMALAQCSLHTLCTSYIVAVGGLFCHGSSVYELTQKCKKQRKIDT